MGEHELMIVSHKNSFIFVAIPKTASQSLRYALRSFTAADDWEQCGFYDKREFPVPHLSMLNTGHMTLLQLRPFLSDSQWHSYQKFAVVRDPLDRFLSACFFTIEGLADCSSIDDEIQRRLDNGKWLRRIHLLPQGGFICDENGELLTDFIVKYQSLYDDAQVLARRLGFTDNLSLPTLNISESRLKDYCPSAAIVDRVRDIYAVDYQLFDYDLKGSIGTNP